MRNEQIDIAEDLGDNHFFFLFLLFFLLESGTLITSFAVQDLVERESLCLDWAIIELVVEQNIQISERLAVGL